MKRSVQTVRREMADLYERSPVCLTTRPGEMLFFEVPKIVLARWIQLLAPPKRKVRPRSPGIKKRRATMRELDATFRQIILGRDEYRCRRCQRTDQLQCAHIFSRRFLRVRHHTSNAMTLCAGCHLAMHHHPIEAGKFFEEAVGKNEYLKMKLVKMATGRTDPEMVKRYLEAEAKRLGVALEKARKEYA